MNLKITGLNFDVTEAVRNRVADKLERIQRHSDGIISATVTLSPSSICPAKTFMWKRRNRKTCTLPLMFWPTNSTAPFSNTKRKAAA